jgi:2-polyprenyl-6-methoxyphenol hydroxylase-like FAD-dependent oxidoreductase
LEVIEFGVPIDVLWFHLSRTGNDPDQLLGNINYGRVLILINRGDYFQAGLVIPKGSLDSIKQEGLEAFRETLLRITPYLGDRVNELKDWDQIKLLSVQINRLRQWHTAGLLCIGDAAHAMSPVGGVGINLAVQDGVAAANLLSVPLLERRVNQALLQRVQERREFPTRVVQRIQITAHKGLNRVFQTTGPLQAPWQLKMIVKVPGFRQLAARVIGIGVRPEHIAGTRKAPAKLDSELKRAAVLVGVTAAVAVCLLKLARPAKN